MESFSNPSDSKTFTPSPQQELSAPFALLVEKNEAGLFALEDDLVSYANPAFLAVVHMKAEDLIGKSILITIAKQDQYLLKDALESMKSGQIKRFSKEVRLPFQEDEEQYFSMHLTVVSEPDEAKLTIIGASRNASARVKKRIELAQTKAKYEALYRNLEDGIFIYNYIEEKIIDCNEAAYLLLGYDHRNEFLEKNRFDIIPKHSIYAPGMDLHEITRQHGLKVVKGETFTSKGVLIGKKGNEILADVNVVPTFEVIGEAFVIFHDTTNVVLNKLALKASEVKYRTIFENSHEAIIYTDVKTMRPILCNKNALQLFGFDDFETLASKAPSDYLADTLIGGMQAEDYAHAKIMEASKEGRAEASYRLRKNNGKIIIIDSILIGDNSNPDQPKVISFVKDITNVYNAQKALNQKNEELKKYIDSNLQLENFAYLASHDLQTPLRSIISFTQLLQRRTKDLLNQEAQEYMNYIVSSSISMQNLINDLLSYSRVNTTEINLQAFNLNDLLDELLIEFHPTIKEKEASIVKRNIPTSIQGDAAKLRQVFQNLLSNALKFNRLDQKPEVIITARQNNQNWVFSIQDNGIGIAQEFQEKIFLLFKRLHSASEFDGTGIGLAMVKKIIEQHKGKIWLESKAGEGTTFYFSLNTSV
ncbi:MAG: ATP-binding protein [Bacteroidota bacterium]